MKETMRPWRNPRKSQTSTGTAGFFRTVPERFKNKKLGFKGKETRL
jgi:hypothetical protein